MTDSRGVWASLERWSPHLFFFGAVFELLFALNNGLAFLLAGFSFVEWLYPTILVARVAVLLGIAGLSVRVVDWRHSVGKWARVLVTVALVFSVGLLSLSLLRLVDVTTPILAVFGIGTVVLSIATYALFGVVIIYSEAFSPAIGALLVAAAVTVLGVFVGLNFLPSRLVGGIGEGLLVVLFLVTSYRLRTEFLLTDRGEVVSTTVTE
ncbi:MAG: hypothetical protein KGY43_07450 [Halodesulfurarchaeum sp.]|nr:hypothetical protein [Halodesulfurarchaeum sp.]